MGKLAAATLCVAGLLLAAALPVPAGPPIQLPALTRIASKLSGLRPKRKVRVSIVSAAAMERHALRLLDRDYRPTSRPTTRRSTAPSGSCGRASRSGPFSSSSTHAGCAASTTPSRAGSTSGGEPGCGRP